MTRTHVALAVGLAVTLGVVVATERGIPALPFLGAAMVMAHREARAVPVEDRRAAVVGLVGMAVLFAGLFYAQARRAPEAAPESPIEAAPESPVEAAR